MKKPIYILSVLPLLLSIISACKENEPEFYWSKYAIISSFWQPTGIAQVNSTTPSDTCILRFNTELVGSESDGVGDQEYNKCLANYNVKKLRAWGGKPGVEVSTSAVSEMRLIAEESVNEHIPAGTDVSEKAVVTLFSFFDFVQKDYKRIDYDVFEKELNAHSLPLPLEYVSIGYVFLPQFLPMSDVAPTNSKMLEKMMGIHFTENLAPGETKRFTLKVQFENEEPLIQDIVFRFSEQ